MLDYHFGDRLPVLNHGHVALLDVMGNDTDIANAARISYDNQGSIKDRALIRYLLRHRHTSPFEMAELKFELKMPIFVARQWVRHRTANMNEVSARYTQLPGELFVPKEIAAQSTDNKQGRQKPMYSLSEDNTLRHVINRSNITSYTAYEALLEAGVSRELARGVLPLNIYTKFVWKMDLHNLMHFLKLRLDPHAQKEIQEYAEVIAKLVNIYFPITYEAFVDYQRDAYLCSRMEVEFLQRLLGLYRGRSEMSTQEYLTELTEIDRDASLYMSDREIKEFKEKFLDG